MTLVEEKVRRLGWARSRVLLAIVPVLAIAVIAAMIVGLSRHNDDPNTSGGSPAAGPASGTLSLAQGEVAGFPRRFPDSTAGAIEAWTGYVTTSWSGPLYSTARIRTYVDDVLTDGAPSSLASDLADLRAKYQLDADGQFIGSPGNRAYSACLPQFGAYKAVRLSGHRVRVETWMPCLLGVGAPNNLSDVHVWWDLSGAVMSWTGGDWRSSAGAQLSLGEAPTPNDKSRVAVPFSERHKLLGAGWTIFANGTASWPTALLGKEPT